MSHQPERKAKDCLNCGSIVHGRYCHVCGQENIVTHQHFGGLVKHFVYDIFHFDGKFFETSKKLLFKPGIVAKEYVQGKRARHLDPIRMYLFTSATFFVFFYSIAKPSSSSFDEQDAFLSNNERIELAEETREKLEVNPSDTLLSRELDRLLDTTSPFKRSDLLKKRFRVFTIRGRQYHSIEEYDSIQKSLTLNERDNWFTRQLIRKSLIINKKYEEKPGEGLKHFFDSFLHRMPYLLFFSLPFFAAILKLLYTRRKNFVYSDHAFFTLYHYIISFLVLLLAFALNGLKNWLHWDSVFNWIILVLVFLSL